MTSQWQAGDKNLITDVPGLMVGNASDSTLKSGVTVLSAQTPFLASVDVMGGAPGSRETELLAPDKLVEGVDALVLSGGSAFGLDAASGVTDGLRQDNRGFKVGPVKVPIVPGAIIFDLINGGHHQWTENPYPKLGRAAYGCRKEVFAIGSAGAGTGATTGSMKGGLGSASLVLPGGLVVGALVVANPHGHVTVQGSRHFWAAPFELDKEFGGLGMAQAHDPTLIPVNNKFEAYSQMYGTADTTGQSPQGMNTTIAIVATNAALSKSQLNRLAVAAQDGIARAVVPSHTPLDGDLVFSVSTSAVPINNAIDDTLLLGQAAAVCLSRAIARGIYEATAAAGDTLPSWQSLHRAER
ncbi:MAG: P1 family peptidase [Granulosicoccus sp.]